MMMMSTVQAANGDDLTSGELSNPGNGKILVKLLDLASYPVICNSREMPRQVLRKSKLLPDGRSRFHGIV